MKIYRSPRQVLSDITRLLATNRPSFLHSPLGDVSELLASGRHYTWAGIYLAVEQNAAPKEDAGAEPHPAQLAHPESRSKVLVSMKLAGRELGVLDVESARANAFGGEERVLLEKVADRVAVFLAGRGQYLVRKARRVAAVTG